MINRGLANHEPDQAGFGEESQLTDHPEVDGGPWPEVLQVVSTSPADSKDEGDEGDQVQVDPVEAEGEARRPHTIFSDQKILTLDRSRNRQNDRFIATMKEDVLPVYKTKNPATVIVFDLVTCDGKIMRPHFFQPKERANTALFMWTC